MGRFGIHPGDAAILEVQMFEEVVDGNVENTRNAPHLCSRYPVLPTLVFLDLLEPDAQSLAELALSKTARLPLGAHAGTNVLVYKIHDTLFINAPSNGHKIAIKSSLMPSEVNQMPKFTQISGLI